MSERGTWITQYIYCGECAAAFQNFLDKTKCIPGDGKYWSYLPHGERVFAGRISGMFAGEELQLFEMDLIPELEALICHPLRIAVVAEDGQEFLTARPPLKYERPSPSWDALSEQEKALREPLADRLADEMDNGE